MRRRRASLLDPIAVLRRNQCRYFRRENRISAAH
jgi:hypothetical protein